MRRQISPSAPAPAPAEGKRQSLQGDDICEVLPRCQSYSLFLGSSEASQAHCCQ